MPRVIPKKDLHAKAWDMLKSMFQEVEDDYLVFQLDEEKVIFQSLTNWLEQVGE